MSKPLGPSDSPSQGAALPLLRTQKKKGCKQKKCSNWKGGKCRCGRE